MADDREREGDGSIARRGLSDGGSGFEGDVRRRLPRSGRPAARRAHPHRKSRSRASGGRAFPLGLRALSSYQDPPFPRHTKPHM
jgi:hypothetical protein